MYSVVDIETTGNGGKEGKITEIAIISFNGERITNSFVSLVNPECSIPYYITKLTGIDNNMVQHAPKFYEIAKEIVLLTANTIFVAHNSAFDYNFIRSEFSRLGYNYQRKTLCTVQLSRKLLPGHASYSLGNLCNNLGITVTNRHRAEGDALATVELLKILLQQHQHTDPGSLFSQKKGR
ncbi:MAG TPA: 3'-5' exonuclease [Prolixibacteraceae bacterium]|nr:3'-5' exonuclease [Prolixibacteraceae bacterium]HQN93775.1 3'-5' exonuclease [Prolixibacteraceae bacterium]